MEVQDMTIRIHIDTTEIEEATKKVEKLQGLLKEVKLLSTEIMGSKPQQNTHIGLQVWQKENSKLKKYEQEPLQCLHDKQKQASDEMAVDIRKLLEKWKLSNITISE